MNRVLPNDEIKFSGPNLIVCEGHTDVRFVSALLNHKRIGDAEIGCPSQKIPDVVSDGKDGIEKYLKGLKVLSSSAPRGLATLALIYDVDDETPEKAFQWGVSVLEAASFNAPSAPYQWSSGTTKTCILLIPGPGKDGTFEHLLWDVLSDTHKSLSECIETFADCSNNQAKWSNNSKAKMRIHSAIASYFEGESGLSMALLWQRTIQGLFPINSARFDFITKVFQEVLIPF